MIDPQLQEFRAKNPQIRSRVRYCLFSWRMWLRHF